MTPPIKQVNKWLSHFSPSKRAEFQEVINRSLDRQVKLAVTGLSRSGKTVFITSLVQHLLHGLETTHLPFLELVTRGRLQGTKIIQKPNRHIPSFRYDLAIEQLTADPPTWPPPTSGLSEIRLAIRYRSNQTLLKHVNPINTLYLDIIDYPGEWLLDLPLLELSYEDWSRQIAQACQQQPRLALSEPWRQFLEPLALTAEANETTLREASALYTEFLHHCKERYQLSLLQPGRFTMPGDLKGAPLLEFCPVIHIPQTYSPNSLYAEMKRRYEAYKEHVVKRFYDEHFASFDRQIVLADVLRAFNTGYPTFADMQAAINTVLKSFQYGKSGILNKFFGLKIDKLLFAATKADHVTPNQLPNLERFIQQMLTHAHHNATFEGVQTATLALAAVKCTQAAYTTFQGQRISCIKGVPLNADKPVALFPGEVPVDIPRPQDWIEDRFNFIEFKPPRLANVQHRGLPHIRLDRALEFLLGDKF
ncbi:MAG: YcjX family protein [Pseudomonadota bacterium]|nr:YcjX family protein [Pseudomonadota bacterium]